MREGETQDGRHFFAGTTHENELRPFLFIFKGCWRGSFYDSNIVSIEALAVSPKKSCPTGIALNRHDFHIRPQDSDLNGNGSESGADIPNGVAGPSRTELAEKDGSNFLPRHDLMAF